MNRPKQWNPEDEKFWESEGKAIATRNLWTSVPCLLSAFAVWQLWSVIVVKMQDLGFPFSKDQLYMLPAIAGLLGGTLRIPNSFMVSLSGGRNAVSVTTGLMIIPCLGAGIALQDMATSYTTFAILAGLSGIGGGAFASSMSNISLFFPKKVQGSALGVNAGFGNLGVSVTQVLLPIIMSAGVFGAIGGAGMVLKGKTIFIQNAGLFWVPVLAVLAVLAWLFMDNLPQHNVGSAPAAIGKALWLELIGFIGGAAGVYIMLAKLDINEFLKIAIAMAVAVAITLALLRFATPTETQKKLNVQFSIFSNKHTWIMTLLYIMTFGSFIGFSAAFPKLIQDVFGKLPGGGINPHAPNPLAYAWLGPLVGSLIRPVGGWLSDKIGGAKVTQWNTVVMIPATLGVAYFVKAAGSAATPETYWAPFFIIFLLLFITSGIGNGSTFRMVPIIFKPELAGPVLGWTSAIAAYGAFIIPKVIGLQIKAGKPEVAMYGFAIFYAVCLVVNYWYYARRGAEIEC